MLDTLINTTDTDTANILLVEDDWELAELTCEYLRKNGFVVNVVCDGLEAVRAILQQTPDLVILDVMLPGLSGMDVCRQVRPHYQGFILMLTALDEDMDQMLGLELGADDYIIKPVQPRLLLSRIRAILRRLPSRLISPTNPQPSQNTENICLGYLCISPSSRHVTWRDEHIELTTAEYDLLELLARSSGDIVDRDTIAQQLRGFEYDGLDRTIDRRISRLRKKLEAVMNKNPIKTIRARGYLLCLDILRGD